MVRGAQQKRKFSYVHFSRGCRWNFSGKRFFQNESIFILFVCDSYFHLPSLPDSFFLLLSSRPDSHNVNKKAVLFFRKLISFQLNALLFDLCVFVRQCHFSFATRCRQVCIHWHTHIQCSQMSIIKTTKQQSKYQIQYILINKNETHSTNECDSRHTDRGSGSECSRVGGNRIEAIKKRRRRRRRRQRVSKNNSTTKNFSHLQHNKLS